MGVGNSHFYSISCASFAPFHNFNSKRRKKIEILVEKIREKFAPYSRGGRGKIWVRVPKAPMWRKISIEYAIYHDCSVFTPNLFSEFIFSLCIR